MNRHRDARLRLVHDLLRRHEAPLYLVAAESDRLHVNHAFLVALASPAPCSGEAIMQTLSPWSMISARAA
jgi:hypothetical protein